MQDEERAALVLTVAEQIMDYLRKNSSAGDTASGVSQWWLHSVRVDVRTVELALEQLAAAGTIGVLPLPSGERFYFGLGGDSGGSE